MNFTQLMGWMQIAQAAIPAGIATEQVIAGWIKSIHGPTMSDAEINAAASIVSNDAARRKALAVADALGQSAPAQA